MEKLPKHLEIFLKEVEEMKKAREKGKKAKKSPEPVRHAQGKLSRKKANPSPERSRREPQKADKTKAAESVDHLTELHKLQGVLLGKLKKQV